MSCIFYGGMDNLSNITFGNGGFVNKHFDIDAFKTFGKRQTNPKSKCLKHEEFISKNPALVNKIPYNKNYLNCMYVKDKKLISKYSPTPGLIRILDARDKNRNAKINLNAPSI
jgi:hypothetical protein